MLLADNERSDTVTIADSSGFHRAPAPHFFRERYSGSYVRQLERFRDALAGEPVTAASGSDGRQAVLVAHAAEMSRREGRTVTLDEAERDAQGQTDARRIG
jgi:myo-inositol 2-dehydrogenase / D-chiro-inositol 1-dehydrogenase